MSSTQIVICTSDMDGADGAHTVAFVSDGVEYEIDLTDAQDAELIALMAPYVANARRVGGRKRNPMHTATRTDHRQDRGAIRTWARANGWPDLADRGRVPFEIMEAYNAATAPVVIPKPAPPARSNVTELPPAGATKKALAKPRTRKPPAAPPKAEFASAK